MANKYTALAIPPKQDLERLYYNDFMTQVEIGIVYNTTQKVVFSWFKKLGIVSRIAYVRNQKRENNRNWKGDDVTYAAFHYRVKNLRGCPKKCEVCGTQNSDKNYDWACVGDYKKVENYKRMCRSCHWKYDKTGNNFPNNNRIPNNKSKNVKHYAK